MSSNSSECLLWGLWLCWEKYLMNLPLTYSSPFPSLPPFPMKGAREATGPTAEPPALFLPPLVNSQVNWSSFFGFYLTISMPRPHIECTTNATPRQAVNVCTVGTVACKRIVVDNKFKEKNVCKFCCCCWSCLFSFCSFVLFLKDGNSSFEINVLSVCLSSCLPVPSFHWLLP